MRGKRITAGVAHVVASCLIAWSMATGDALAQDAGTPPAGTVVLNEQAYCRAYLQFGWERLYSKPLKEDGERALGKGGLRRMQWQVRERLAYAKIDWSKTDWRDYAVTRYVTVSHGLSRSAVLMTESYSPPPPSDWLRPGFDDRAWQRFITPLGGGYPSNVMVTGYPIGSLGLQAVFLRYRFHVTDPAKAGSLLLRARYVGGIRLFINGEEVGRGHLRALPDLRSTDGQKVDARVPTLWGEGYPETAYRRRFDELSEEEKARARWSLKGKDPPEYWGFADANVLPGSRLYELRNRSIGPVTVPARLLRAGENVLAVEIRSAPLHPLIVRETGSSPYAVALGWLHAVLSGLELRATGSAIRSALRRPAGVQVWAEDPHRRVFSPEYLEPGAAPGSIRMVGARNGTYGAQIVVGTDRDLARPEFAIADLAGRKGNVLPAASIQALGMAKHSAKTAWPAMGEGMVRSTPFLSIPGYRNVPEYMADVRYSRLLPGKDSSTPICFFDQITRSGPETIPADSCQPFWIRARIREGAKPDLYRGTIQVKAAGTELARIPIEIEVVDWTMPPPRHLQTLMAVEQSPYGVAKAYKVPLWSDEHFKYVEASIKEMSRVGNDWWFVPVIHHTEFGNREDSMIRWIREADGSLSFDFALLDRYLDLIVKHCGVPRVIAFVVMHGAPAPVQVKVLDGKTGKEETVSLGGREFDPETRRRYWHAFAKALYGHMKARGLEDAMHWGYAWDTEGDPKLKELLRECVPDVFWSFGAHSRVASGSGGGMDPASLGYYRAISLIFGTVPDVESKRGWKHSRVFLLNPRWLSSCSTTEGIAPPFNYRLMVDRALVSGMNGMGRVGGDYWANSYYDGCRVHVYHPASFSILTVLWPGPDGAEPGARYEAMLEGMQEAEARIFIEQALDKDLLAKDVAARAEALLREHNRATLYMPGHVTGHLFTEGAPGWLARSRRLYRAAAEVGAIVGLDTERREIETAVAPLAQAEVRVKLRNWTGSLRAWKAAGSHPWIVPRSAGGAHLGVQSLKVRIDGAKLKPNSTATGTLTVTDVESGRAHPVKIIAKVSELFEIPTKTVVVNAAAGRQTEREGLTLINRSGAELTWAVESPQPWLRAEPGKGTLAPGGSQAFKLLVEPPDKTHAIHRTALTIRAGGQRTGIEVTTYVIPAYRKPELPRGRPLWLLDALNAKLVRHASHTCGGYNRQEELKKPPAERKTVVVGSWLNSPRYDGHSMVGCMPYVPRSDRERVPFTMGGRQYLRGLWTLPHHETTYALERSGVEALSAEVGFNAYMERNTSASRVGFNFEIYVDGKLRTQSGLLRVGDKPRLLVVEDLQTAKTLQLVTRREDNANALTMTATWGDPTFYAAGPPGLLAERYEKERQLWTRPPGVPIRQWAFLGPFPTQEHWGRLGKAEPHPAPKGVDFSRRYKGLGDAQLRWRKVEADGTGFVDLAKVLQRDPANTVVFCGAILEAPKAQLIQLGIGACTASGRNGFMLWLNGEPVLTNQGIGSAPNTDRLLVPVEQGNNALLVRMHHTPAHKGAGLVVTYRGDGVESHLPAGAE